MTQSMAQLSNNAISYLSRQSQDSESIIVQVIDFHPKKDKFYITISDGNLMTKALPNDQKILDSANDLNTIICIKKHMTGKNNVVGILQFQKLFNYKTRIGNPQQFNQDSISPENTEPFNIQKQMIDLSIKCPRKNQDMSTAVKIEQKQKKTSITLPINRSAPLQTTNKPLIGSLSDYQTINTLYLGMDRWTVICRVVKISYAEFISKKTGKQTKILNMELMDRAGMKISGVAFGQAAQKWRDHLIKDRVYQISKGQIREESYNNSKNQKMSPFKLIFSNLSEFQQVSDTSSIAKNQDAATTLGECVERRVIGQQYDIICILVKIEETVQVKKDDGLLKKTNLLVADPIRGITLHAVLWNDQLIPDKSLTGKAVILSRFKLSMYRDTLSLGSLTYKSSIIPVQQHAYKQLESKVMSEYNEYEKLHEIKYSGNQQNAQVCTTMKQLEQRIQNLEADEWARSDLTVHIKSLALRKWHYDGCPYCEKAAESLSSCTNMKCGKYVQKTVGHFIMGVQICDYTGSLWTTAYDDWAKKIFNVSDQAIIIDNLLKLDTNQLKQQAQSYIYQQFRIRLSSKKDKENRIKHHVSKIYERDFVNETMKNIELIDRLSTQ